MRRIARFGNRIPHSSLFNCFDAGSDIADFAGAKRTNLLHVRLEHANLIKLIITPRCHETDICSGAKAAVKYPHIADYAFVVVVNRVKDQSLQRCLSITLGSRDITHNSFEYLGHTVSGLGADGDSISGVNTDNIFYFFFYPIGLSRR